MVFHAAGEHHVPLRRKRETAGQLVDRLGGVLAENAGMIGRVGPDEAQRQLAGLFVSVGRELTLEAGAAVHAAVVRQEIIDGALHNFQRRG